MATSVMRQVCAWALLLLCHAPGHTADTATKAAVKLNQGVVKYRELAQPAQVTTELKTLSTPTTLHDLAAGNRLDTDEETLHAVKRLNPRIDFSRPVPAGQQVIVPKWTASEAISGSSRLRLTYADLATRRVDAVNESTKRTTVLARQLQANAFASPATHERYKKVFSDVEAGNARLRTLAPSMSSFDLAYFELANRSFNRAATAQLSAGAVKIEPGQIQTLEEQSASLRALSGCTSNLDECKTPVTVTAFHAGTEMCGLRVFVLPAGFVAAASSFSEDELTQNLRDLTFEAMTSPSTQLLFPANYEFALGAEDAFVDIVAQTRAGKLTSSPVSVGTEPKAVVMNASGGTPCADRKKKPKAKAKG